MCKSCHHLVVLSEQGYFSCENFCDFDLCRSCVTCSIDGSLLYETNEVPSQDTIRWQQFCMIRQSENYFESSTADTTSLEGFAPLKMPNPKGLRPIVKILLPMCCRCNREFGHQEIKTDGYLNCMQC